jgi:hypothetical protein
VVFSYVGPNNGNYRQQNTTANGKVFEWLEPLGGNPQGDYEPVEILIAPVRNQMLVLGLDHQVNENWEVKTEWSLSQNDLNTFSDLGESDNIGNGLMVHVTQNQKLGNDSSMWKIRSNFRYERASKNFRFIERYRGVEFNRMWNRTLYNEGESPMKLGNEHIAQADIHLQNGRKMQVDLVGAYFQRSNTLDAWQHQFNWSYQPGLWTMRTTIEQLRGDQPFEEEISSNTYDHYNVYLGRRIRSQQLGFNFKQEQSLFNDAQSDSLTAASYSFHQYTAFLARDSGTFSYRLEFNQREDAQIQAGDLNPYTLGRDAKFNTAWQVKKNIQLSLLSSYRRLSFNDSLAKLKDEETMQGRFELRWSFFKNSVRTQTYYQIGSGQEQKREFSYIPVGDGNGIYVWNDYDENGIQTLDEFEIASDFDRPRANFIRQFLPVSGLVKTYSTEFNNNIRIQANRRSKKKNAFLVFLNRFSMLSNTRIQKKLGSNAADLFLNPFYLEIADSTLISSNNTYRNTLSFNRSHPIFGADYQQLRNNGKTLLLNGFDSRSNLEHRFKIRWNIDKKWEVLAVNSFGSQSYESDFLSNRSYLYNYVEWTPSVQYYLNKNFRLGGEYKYFEAHNDPKFGIGASYNHELSANFQLNYLNKGNVRFNLALIEVNFKGSESSALGYALLEGLKNGRNIAWSVNIDQRFSNNVQGLITYDGRVSESSPIIHIGRVQLRYLF